MATWKKIIVSGSTAVLGGVTLPSLTTNNLIQVGSGGVLQDSGISLASSTASFGNVALTNTSAGSSLSGSFSGSFAGAFTGTFTGTTDLPDLTDGNGIVDFTYDGSSTATITVEADGSTLSVGSGGVKVADAGITATQINTSVAGNGLSGGGGAALAINLNELTPAVVNVVHDSIAIVDASSSSGSRRESVVDFVSAIAGTNLSAASGQINLPSTIAGNTTFSNNVTVDGDLTVGGTTTTLNTTNLLVEDKFILLNSGSANPDEGGIIIDEGSAKGHAFVYDADASRFAFTSSLAHDAANVTPDAFVAAVVDLASSHTDVAEYQKNGNIKIASNGDIFIYS